MGAQLSSLMVKLVVNMQKSPLAKWLKGFLIEKPLHKARGLDYILT